MATYTVVSGDTLAAIASNLGVADWRDLYVDGVKASEVDPRRLSIGANITTTPEGTDAEEGQTVDDAAANAPITAQGPGDDAVVSGQIINESTGEITATGIMGGGQTIRLPREGVEDLWFEMYQVPGTNTFVYFQYDPTDADEDGWPDELVAIHGPRPAYGNTTQEWFDRKSADGSLQIAGQAVDIQGVTGDFDLMWTQSLDDALKAAGVTDPGLRGRILNDPRGEMATILTLASLPGSTITQDEITATMRNSEIWQEIYPGIDYFFNIGHDEPESAWRQYQNSVSSTLRQLGVTPDEDGSYRSTIGDMLSEGVSADEFNDFAPVLINIQNNPQMKDTFDQWAQIELGRPLDFDEFIDVMAGTSDPELNAVVESATLAYAAEQAGVQASVEDIRRIAEFTDLSPEQALAAFSQTEKAILAIGNQDLQPFGVSQGDFLDVAAGVAPRSGLSAVAVGNVAAQLAQERAISDDPSARFFAGFNQRQQIQRQGLGSTRQVGG